VGGVVPPEGEDAPQAAIRAKASKAAVPMITRHRAPRENRINTIAIRHARLNAIPSLPGLPAKVANAVLFAAAVTLTVAVAVALVLKLTVYWFKGSLEFTAQVAPGAFVEHDR